MYVRRSLFVLILLIFVVPIAVFRNQAMEMQQSDRAPVDIQQAVVARGDVEVTVNAIGTIEAERTARLSFDGGGRVRDVLFDVGDFVLAGDVLVELENDAQVIAVDQAEIALQMAELQRQQLFEGPDEGQIAVAEANITSARGALAAIAGAVSDADIRTAELAVESAQAAYDDAVFARTRASGGQPDEAYALLDARVGQASFELEIARLQLQSLRNGAGIQTGPAAARVRQAELELERLLAGPTEAQIDQADAQIERAQIDLENANADLDATRIVAPFDGYLAALNVERGGLIVPSLPVAEIIDVSPLTLTVQVDEIDIRQIEPGLTARVQVDALPGVELPANLQEIALVSTNTGGIVSYDVQVQLDADDERVRVGMTAEASVVVEARRDTLVVPNAYIRLDRGQDRAFVNLLRADGTLEEVEVTLGLQGQDSSEILAGVSEGDVVAVDLSGDALFGFGGP
ncbi:MAG: efflux RND transporter periplasmic adaptor subunit [Chloroflexi bacterium]|nr:efflux RND transporter periplasmic adaptor subunit [Chloroflexota bacterium]